MNNNEIKKANKKALPQFILIIIISLIIGGTMGYYSARFSLNNLTGSIKAVAAFFGANIAPWLMVAIMIIIPVICIPLYKKTKDLLTTWDGENEDVSDNVDKLLSTIVWITSSALIISYFLIAASYSGGFAIFENKKNLLPFFIGIIAFLIILFETIIIQQKCVDATKKTNPEKTASVYDIKFQKKWMDSCDEAEKILIGKCSFKAYSATNTVCSLLAIVLAVCALIFETGFLPSLVVCLIWIINMSVFCKESLKYSKAGNKIS